MWKPVTRPQRCGGNHRVKIFIAAISPPAKPMPIRQARHDQLGERGAQSEQRRAQGGDRQQHDLHAARSVAVERHAEIGWISAKNRKKARSAGRDRPR
jgi:hypothetical protein